MSKALIFSSIALVLIATFSAPQSSARGRKHYRIAQGNWGGTHIRVTVGDSSATIEFDCAHGQIDGPLVTDRRGRFKLKGTFSPEHGGPVRDNEQSAGQPASYAGWTDGKKMTLTVALAGQKETIGTFDLTLGGGGRLFKCR
ncbi:MAG TPA: hypothetical protein VLQ90_04145 [Pyrinomonadaceae bacterium]|nr:hypothetical protein [Pyrinomonadaceae bacterium]